MRTVVIVPCYNEAHRLPVERFAAFVRDDAPISIVFVDDGSRDKTRAALQQLCAQAPGRLRLLALDRNQGKAEAVRRGVLSALAEGCDLVGYWDADLATPLDILPRFIGRFNDPQVQIVMGSRVKLLGRRIERRAVRHYPGRVMATFASIVLGLGVYDTQCGAKLFRSSDALRSVFGRPFMTTWVFDVEILARFLVLARQGNLPFDPSMGGIVEYPVEEWCDIPGSKISFFDGLRAPFDLCRIYRYLRRSV